MPCAAGSPHLVGRFVDGGSVSLRLGLSLVDLLVLGEQPESYGRASVGLACEPCRVATQNAERAVGFC
jgi:hypothetical protein